MFERDNWAEQALRALQRVPLLQPFQRVYEPPADSRDPCGTIPSDAPLGDSLAHLQSLGLVTSDMLQGAMRLKSRSNSGLAWVARREVIDRDGFYDACVMGSGNRAMVCAALGTPADAIRYICMTPAWAEHYRAWATRHLANVRGSIGFTEGTLIHLWHGELNDRRYQERHRAFSAYDFDPNADIALDENGSWRWSSEKRAMHACVADYFRSRREDGV
ncbi:MAG TPA: hypothetical protein VL742_06770 [Casimicrobiaceae bacterium]|nr:hypothetical protein [Casimicrobiaceae bacterium]